MELFKKFSNLFDINIIKQLSNKDILISSSNQIKIYSIETFEKIYYFKEIESPITSIKSICEIIFSKKNEILLGISLSDFSIQIIKLVKRIKSLDFKKKLSSFYRHELLQTIGIQKNNNVENIYCINSFLNYLIIGINNKIQYYINKGEKKINFAKEKEYKINPKLKQKGNYYQRIRGISPIIFKKNNLLLIIEEIQIVKKYDLKIYFFKNFELITHFSDIYLYPDKSITSLMTNSDRKEIFFILGDKYDRIMIVKLFDDMEIYENINLSKIIKELSFNKNNRSDNYEIKSVCGLNDGSFVICLYYKEINHEKNYIIRGKINNTTKKFELLYINDNVHNNKSNFITFSIMIKNNKKIEKEYFVSGDHEGMIKIWNLKTNFK